ncbi:hypothetical protein GCM10027168_12370 [Streptomyces capparidis]
MIRPLAAAGFIVPGPHFQFNMTDVNNGNMSKDVSEILTQTLALNSGSGPLAGHIDTAAGVGVAGHSMGGMTTHGLLTAWPDSRVKAAIPMSCVDMGNPSSAVSANVLFIHGDRDTTCPISSARQAYSELPAPKGFLTFLGGGHSNFFGDTRNVRTFLDWMRWSLYDDTAARDRLPSDAQSSGTTWEFVGESNGPAHHRLVVQHSGKAADVNEASTAAGARLIQWTSGSGLNQQFQFLDTGDGHVRIKARHSGLVLQAAGNEGGADITQQPDTGAAAQQWRLVEHGDGTVSLVNRASGLAMDVWEYSTADGARISQWTYTGNANQRFTRQRV